MKLNQIVGIAKLFSDRKIPVDVEKFLEDEYYSSSKQMKNTNTKVKTIEKEKVVAETLNGRFAMLGLIAAVGAYLTTGQIIPGFV